MKLNLRVFSSALVLILTFVLFGCGFEKSPNTSLNAGGPTNNPTPNSPIAPTYAQGTGKWSLLPQTMPVNPIHISLLNTNQIYVIAGSGNCPPGFGTCPAQNIYPQGSGLLDLNTFNTAVAPLDIDLFCSNMTQMEDGRLLIQGGNLAYGQLNVVGQGNMQVDPFKGLATAEIFDINAGLAAVQPGAHGRWYPTTTLLGDGSVMTMAGLDENGQPNNTSEVYNVAANSWSAPVDPDLDPDFVIPGGNTCDLPGETWQNGCFVMSLYPRNILLPSGEVFYSGPDTLTAKINPATNKWSFVAWGQFQGGERTYGSNVLLPLTPANNWNPVVFIVGGSNPATNSTELLDLGNPVDGCGTCWVPGPNMVQPRVESQATLLPDGRVLVDSGSASDEDATTASLKAELYDPVANTFVSAGSNAKARLYHNTQLLLPDGSVLLMGGNPGQGVYDNSMEIYHPPYFYNQDGSLATRPTISQVAATAAYGSTLSINAPNASSIGTVVLMHPGSDTHSFDTAQRYVGLSFTASGNTLTANVPTNSNLLPPGYYMLFVVTKAGVPSVASWIQIYGPATPVTEMKISVSHIVPSYVAIRAAQAKTRHVTEDPLPQRKEMHMHMMAPATHQ